MPPSGICVFAVFGWGQFYMQAAVFSQKTHGSVLQ